MKRLALCLGLLWSTANATVTDLGVLQPAHTYFTQRTDLDGFFSDTLTFTLPKEAAPGFIVNWIQLHNFDFDINGDFLSVDSQEFTGHRNIFGIYPGNSGLPITFTLSGHGGATFALGDQRVFTPGQYMFEVTAVPETDTWLMLLAGIGFMAWFMRPKHA